MPSRRDGPRSIWDTHGFSGNDFANPQSSSSAPYPQELNPWGTTIEEPLHMSTAEKSERPEQNRDLRSQSGPSAKDSVIFSGGDSSKNYGADQQRLQILDLNFDKFHTPATFACWKIRFKTEVCTCSQFTTEAMQWIKEVEMVDSVDDLKSSSSIRSISLSNFEVLDARIASALNKIIRDSHFKRRSFNRMAILHSSTTHSSSSSRWQPSSDLWSTWSLDSWKSSSWTEQWFFFHCSSDVISLVGNLISWQSTGSVSSAPTAHTFFSCTVVVQSYFHWLHALISRITRGSRITEHLDCVCPQNIHISSRNVVRHASLDDTKHGHSFLTYPEPFLQRAQPLRRSTATAEWRFGWAPIFHSPSKAITSRMYFGFASTGYPRAVHTITPAAPVVPQCASFQEWTSAEFIVECRCSELDPDYAESVICESLVILTESADANATSQSSTSSAQGNLSQDYFEKFAEPPEDQCFLLTYLSTIQTFSILNVHGKELPKQPKRIRSLEWVWPNG